MPNKFDEKNLVALVFAPNNCYVNVVGLDKVVVGIDIEKGVWYHKNNAIPIGKGRYTKYKKGIIGIYDRTNIDHLDSMVHQVKEATRDRSSLLED